MVKQPFTTTTTVVQQRAGSISPCEDFPPPPPELLGTEQQKTTPSKSRVHQPPQSLPISSRDRRPSSAASRHSGTNNNGGGGGGGGTNGPLEETIILSSRKGSTSGATGSGRSGKVVVVERGSTMMTSKECRVTTADLVIEEKVDSKDSGITNESYERTPGQGNSYESVVLVSPQVHHQQTLVASGGSNATSSSSMSSVLQPSTRDIHASIQQQCSNLRLASLANCSGGGGGVEAITPESTSTLHETVFLGNSATTTTAAAASLAEFNKAKFWNSSLHSSTTTLRGDGGDVGSGGVPLMDVVASILDSTNNPNLSVEDKRHSVLSSLSFLDGADFRYMDESSITVETPTPPSSGIYEPAAAPLEPNCW